MNKTVTIESNNYKYANTYGGDIYASDFCTDYKGTRNIASRIVSAWKFDEENTKRIKIYLLFCFLWIKMKLKI